MPARGPGHRAAAQDAQSRQSRAEGTRRRTSTAQHLPLRPGGGPGRGTPRPRGAATGPGGGARWVVTRDEEKGRKEGVTGTAAPRLPRLRGTGMCVAPLPGQGAWVPAKATQPRCTEGAGARGRRPSPDDEPAAGTSAWGLCKGARPRRGDPRSTGRRTYCRAEAETEPRVQESRLGGPAAQRGEAVSRPAGQRGRGAPQTARPAEPAAPPATPGPSSALATAEPGPAGAGRPDRSRRPALPVTWVPRARGHIKPRNAH